MIAHLQSHSEFPSGVVASAIVRPITLDYFFERFIANVRVAVAELRYCHDSHSGPSPLIRSVLYG